MASRDELRETLHDYVALAQKSESVIHALRNWNCVIYIEAIDIPAAFTMTIKDSNTTIADGIEGPADLIIRGSSEELANVFWSESKPVSDYTQGTVQIQGSQDHVTRLDKMALLIYREANK